MKRIALGLFAAVMGLGLALTTPDADARRLGGGGSAGMSRTMPKQAPDTPRQPPAGQQAPAAPAAAPAAAGAGAGAAAQAGRRGWMAPVAGLAAGLGIAALMSHLGLGAELANFITILLIALVAFFVIRLIMRRFSGAPAQNRNQMQFAGASAGGQANPPANPWGAQNAGASAGSAATSAAAPAALAPLADASPAVAHNVPADFDTAGFERIAKMIFIRLQAANDAGDLDDLRRFTTPELFASVRLDLQDRPAGEQRTDVVQLDAQVIDFTREQDREIVSVRYHGLIREEIGGVAQPFDEVWHLVKPVDGSREWAIAGIQQSQ